MSLITHHPTDSPADTAASKQQLRAAIRAAKARYTPGQLAEASREVLALLEAHPRFAGARTVLLYHALPDEVQTRPLIEQWCTRKRILLPVVQADRLELRLYTPHTLLRPGPFGIGEPDGQAWTDYEAIDLAVVPGMAFDGHGSRLGRGKGYYDRLLPQLAAYKIGICFGFQLVSNLPVTPADVAMDEVLSATQCR